MESETLSDSNIQNKISHVVNSIEVETHRVITKTDTELSEKNESIAQQKINQVLDHIKISQIQYTDKVADVSVDAATVSSDSACAQEDSEKETSKWI